jgi:hypothetical protein
VDIIGERQEIYTEFWWVSLGNGLLVTPRRWKDNINLEGMLRG